MRLAWPTRSSAQLEVLKDRFPDDVAYEVIYDSTDFVRATVHEIVYTLALTGVIVLLVVFVFLQDWRATLIPALTIPVSLIGVFAVLLAFGFSANTVTLFALILAIGLVVDDAIVVVENVQRVMEEEPGHPSGRGRAQGDGAGDRPDHFDHAGAVRGIPAGGVPARHHRPALPAVRDHDHRLGRDLRAQCADAQPGAVRRLPAGRQREARGPFRLFQLGASTRRATAIPSVNRLLARRSIVAGLIVVAFGGVASWKFSRTPTAFIPTEDQGVLFVNVQLPDAAALPRTQAGAGQGRRDRAQDRRRRQRRHDLRAISCLPAPCSRTAAWRSSS